MTCYKNIKHITTVWTQSSKWKGGLIILEEKYKQCQDLTTAQFNITSA